MYNVIYADPPWTYDNKSVDGGNDGKDISIDGRYELMTLDDLKKFPIKDITEKVGIDI